MKKKCTGRAYVLLLSEFKHVWRVAKLALSLLLCTTIAFSGNINSQTNRISIVVHKLPTQEVLKQIEKQTDFLFVYNNEKIDLTRPISLEISDLPLESVLKEIFQNTGIEYVLEGNNILLTKQNFLPRGKARLLQGIVKDQTGEPIIGANVVVKGSTSVGTVTDVDGRFSLEVADTDVLQISYIGYMTREITVKDKKNLDITIMEDMKNLDEVIVVGYGTQKKVNLTGAVNVISDKDFKDRQASTVSQLLQGAAPGFNLDISNQDGFQPGATMNISIRGMGSLNGGSPYVLIDGFPGDLNNLNPEDIESVSVLKDAAASAIYGARAPYGVILITTKKGRKNEKVSVSYTGNLIVKTAQKLPQSLDSYTWTRVLNEAGDNMGGHPFSNETVDRIIAYQKGDFEYIKNSIPDWPDGATIFGATPEGNVWNNANLNYANTDWWDIYFGNSVNQKHDLSLHGGSDKVSYYFSAGYMDDNSVLNFGTDYFKRINTLGKIDVAITDWWNFGYETRFAKKIREKPNMTKEGDYSFMYRHISRNYPITPLYDGFGHYMFESHIPSIESGTDRLDEMDLWNNFRMELRPLKGWKINADFAYNVYNSEISDVEKYIYIYDVNNMPYEHGVSIPNNLTRRKYIKKYWTSNVYTSYDFNINEDHNFTILAGMQFERGDKSWIQGYKTDLIAESVPAFPTATGDGLLSEALAHNATESYFARLNYNYKERYLFESNVRYDGSYVFRHGKRWGVFPSFSIGWNVYNEPFWKNIEPYVNTLKIRASWGQLGNQNISPYSDLELVPIRTDKLNWIFNYGSTRPVGYTTGPNLVNRNLTWETATTANLGLDMSFLDNRLKATVDLFERRTTDMIGPSQAMPGVLGADVPKDNNSTLRTRGWELTLDWKQVLSNGLSYNIGVSLYDYRSVVTKYFNPTGTLSTWYEGREVGDIWGYTVNDLFRTQGELDAYLSKVDISHIASKWNTGDLKYEDINHDGKVNNGKNTIDDHGDLSIIGNDQPHYQYTIHAGAAYKGFDFSMLWRGVAKKDMYFYRMSNIFWGFTNGWWESCLTPGHLDYFRDQPGTKYSGLYEGDANINTDAYWPRPYLNDTEEAKNKNNPNTRYLQNAAYLRLQNVQIGYNLPQSIISKMHLEKLRIYFSGENLLTFSKLPDGVDPVAPVGFPEGGSGNYYGTAGSGRLTYGADRIYSVGLTITY